MTPLEMIAEWRKGCSNTESNKPWQCEVCMRALVDSLESQLKAMQNDEADLLHIAYMSGIEYGKKIARDDK